MNSIYSIFALLFTLTGITAFLSTAHMAKTSNITKPQKTARAANLKIGKCYRLKITRISDGDTFYARARLSGWSIFKRTSKEIQIRPDDYDSAESLDPSRPISESEKAAGKRAAEALKQILIGDVHFIWNGRMHRNRYIGRVIVNNTDLGILMVTNGMQDQRTHNRPQHSISWIEGQTRRLEWFPKK